MSHIGAGCRKTLGACVLVAVTAAASCGGSGRSPTSASLPEAVPSPTASPACSPWPVSTDSFAQLGCPLPAPDQQIACTANARPTIGQVEITREDRGLRVVHVVVDPDASRVMTMDYLNNSAGGGCGGLRRSETFVANLTFPVAVRIVAWDEHGGLAEPICRTVE
jgi:hypothetical protein